MPSPRQRQRIIVRVLLAYGDRPSRAGLRGLHEGESDGDGGTASGDDAVAHARELCPGPTGLLTMDTDRAELVPAVRILTVGGAQVAPSAAPRLVHVSTSQPVGNRAPSERFDQPTVREREVVAFVADGLANQEIAERLVVSPATAKTHADRSMVKFQS